MGRMGQQLIKSSKKNTKFKLVSITENRFINKKIAGLKPSKNSIDAFKRSNVIIDFTVPKCTLEILKIASKLKKKVVIGTTGFSKKEENLIKKYSRKIPILKAGNMSLGVNLLMYLTEIASNAATAIIMTPITLSLAASFGFDPKPFIFAVCFAASASFITPVGYQTNLMVFGPGGYRYSDYIKVGLPLGIILWIVSVIMIPIIWPFKIKNLKFFAPLRR